MLGAAIRPGVSPRTDDRCRHACGRPFGLSGALMERDRSAWGVFPAWLVDEVALLVVAQALDGDAPEPARAHGG